jgi:hypothetical protein
VEFLTPEALCDPTDELQEIPRLCGWECPEGNLDPAIECKGLPSLRIPVVALRDGETIRGAVFIEETAEELLGPYLVEFLHDFGRTERFAG